MALPDQAVLQVGTDIIVADSTDHSPATANNFGTRTHQIDLTSVADDAARQSDKIDLGESRAQIYAAYAAIEFAATPTAGEHVELYWAESPSGTAAQGNLAGISGSDGTYAGLGSDLTHSLSNLRYIGALTTTDDPTTTVQSGFVGCFSSRTRYGSLVVVNKGAAAFHSDAVEMSVLITPQVVKTID